MGHDAKMRLLMRLPNVVLLTPTIEKRAHMGYRKK